MSQGDPVLEQCLGVLAYRQLFLSQKALRLKEPENRARVRGLPVRRPSPAPGRLPPLPRADVRTGDEKDNSWTQSCSRLCRLRTAAEMGPVAAPRRTVGHFQDSSHVAALSRPAQQSSSCFESSPCTEEDN